MKERAWKTALWNRSWDDLSAGKYNAEGTCRFSDDVGVRLEIPFGDISRTRELEETGRYVHSLESTRYDYLYGFTQDGVRLVLGDVLSDGVGSSSPGGTYENLRANTVLSSRHEFDPHALINTVDFEVEGLREWLGVGYNPEVREGKAEIGCEGEDKSLDVYRSGRCSMEIRYGTKGMRRGRDGISVSTYAAVHIDYANAVSLDDFWSRELWGFQSFLTFCFGSYPAICRASVKFEGDGRPVDVHRGSFPSRGTRRDYQSVPVPFVSVKDALSDVVTRWMEMEGDEFQSSKMLASLLGPWKMPIDLQLFAASSMFESLARSGCGDVFDSETLKRMVAPMLDAADESIRGRSQGLLSLLKRPSYSMLLDSAYEESGRWGRKMVPNWELFRKEQVKLRNAGAHALGNGGEYEKMVDHHDAQVLIAYIIVMRRLGLPDEAFDRFEDSTFMNVSKIRVSRHYAVAESQ